MYNTVLGDVRAHVISYLFAIKWIYLARTEEKGGDEHRLVCPIVEHESNNKLSSPSSVSFRGIVLKTVELRETTRITMVLRRCGPHFHLVYTRENDSERVVM